MAQQLTPKYALPYYQGVDLADGASQQQALATRLDAVLSGHTSGLASARPAAGTLPAESYYFATDTGVLSRSDGTAWSVVTPADNSVTAAKIVDGTVGTAELADGAVTTPKITDANVTTAKLVDQAVTVAKMAAASNYVRLLGTASLGGYNIGPNVATTLGSVACSHTGGRGGMWLLIEMGNPSGTGSASQFNIRIDGAVVNTVSNSNAGLGSAAGAAAYGSTTGTHTWSVSVEMGNVPYTIANNGLGLLAVFEF